MSNWLDTRREKSCDILLVFLCKMEIAVKPVAGGGQSRSADDANQANSAFRETKDDANVATEHPWALLTRIRAGQRRLISAHLVPPQR